MPGCRPPRSTPRSTGRRCAAWPGHGQEVQHDRHPPGHRRLPGRAPGAGIQAGGPRLAAGRLRLLHGDSRRRHHYHRAGPGLGHPARRRPAVLARGPAAGGPRLRPPPAGDRSRHRGPPGGPAGLPQPPGHALPVLRRRGRRPDGRHGLAAPRPARRHPQDPDRPAGRGRHAARGGDPPGPDRPGRRRGNLDDPGQQVREKQADPAAPEHARRAGRLRAAPRSALSRPRDAEPAGVHRRDPADQPGHPLRLRPAGPPGRPGAPLAGLPAPAARLPPLPGGKHAARLVPAGPGRAGPAARAIHLPRPHQAGQHLLVSLRGPRTAGSRRRAPPDRAGGALMSALAPTLQAFFTGRRHASPNTVAAYRDAWRLILRYAHERTGKQPCQLDLADLDAPFVAGFLDHLEQDRGNSIRTRNARLAAIRSFFRYAALCHPEHAGLIARVLAIPAKKTQRNELCYLSQPEADALLAAPDRGTWTGRRDHALLDVALDTGLRVSELTGLRNSDAELGTGAHLTCTGKGRKNRSTPLRKQTAAVLAGKNITPHTLRHSCAMSLLAQGVDTAVIALWLGHERVETTQIYVHADMSIKERALARTAPPNTTPGRYRPPDSLLAFLTSL